MSELTFQYSALSVFRDAKNRQTELRVILLKATNRVDAMSEAERLMKKYAVDFDVEYDGINVYEFGSDMLEEYSEVFSVTWTCADHFERLLCDKLF